MSLRIQNPARAEDFAFYEHVYGVVDFTDKTVLDIGADVGSTADYFLQKGAHDIFAVEGSDSRFQQLKANIGAILLDPDFQVVKPIRFQVDSPEILAGWFYMFMPDVVKYDLDTPGEYFEKYLSDLPPQCLQLVSEYLVEIHTRPTARRLIEHFRQAGFRLVVDNLWAPPNTSVAYFQQKKSHQHPLETLAPSPVVAPAPV